MNIHEHQAKELLRQYGIPTPAGIAAFSVRRQGNASFVRPLAGHRSQIYSEMTLDDFVKNLNVFQEENLR